MSLERAGCCGRVDVVITQGYIAPPSDPDSMRWGKNEGCEFITNSAAEWSQRYFCSQLNQQGCSYDNRMAAYCAISTDITNVPQTYSQTQFWTGVVSTNQPRAQCTDTHDCELPTMFQVAIRGVVLVVVGMVVVVFVVRYCYCRCRHSLP